MASSSSTASTRTATGSARSAQLRRWWSRSFALALVGLLAACGTDSSSSAGGGEDLTGAEGASCPAELVFEGRTYQETPHVKQLPRTQRLGEARFTSCIDSDDVVPAWALPGTDAATAFVAELGSEAFLYVEESQDPCSVAQARCADE